MNDPEEQASTTPPAGTAGPEPEPAGRQPSDDPLRPTRLKSPFIPGELKKRDCLNCQRTVETRSGYCPDCGRDLRGWFPGELITRSARTDAVLGFLTVLGLVLLGFGISVGLCVLISLSDRGGYIGLVVLILSPYILTPILGVLVPVILQRRLRWRRRPYVRGLYSGTAAVATLVLGAYAVCGGLWIRGSL